MVFVSSLLRAAKTQGLVDPAMRQSLSTLTGRQRHRTGGPSAPSAAVIHIAAPWAKACSSSTPRGCRDLYSADRTAHVCVFLSRRLRRWRMDYEDMYERLAAWIVLLQVQIHATAETRISDRCEHRRVAVSTRCIRLPSTLPSSGTLECSCARKASVQE